MTVCAVLVEVRSYKELLVGEHSVGRRFHPVEDGFDACPRLRGWCAGRRSRPFALGMGTFMSFVSSQAGRVTVCPSLVISGRKLVAARVSVRFKEIS